MISNLFSTNLFQVIIHQFFNFRNVASQVHSALDELNADDSHYIPSHPSGGGREAEELFLLPDCVHIFFVTGSGKVSTFSEPSTLRIFKFKDDTTSQDSTDAKVFIQVSASIRHEKYFSILIF